MAKTSKRVRAGRPTPRTNNHDFPVVGLGASAGGIRALEQFFDAMPSDAGMAFVIILHLSPEYESNLASMIQRKTLMPVVQVNESVKVKPNHVYVIPPAMHLRMVDGTIRLADPEHDRGRRVPIDLFFRSLGDAYREHAIGVVLSGTGTDGTLGLRRIKEEGGISLAQDPQEAEYDGMPRSAIAEGLVDFVMPVASMPEKLIGIKQASERIQLPPDGDHPPRGEEVAALRDILSMLRIRTGHDFSNYKQSTILRRVTRRMQVSETPDLASYLQYLREHTPEVQELQQDMLISVTNFFRDHGAFDFLNQEIMPKLFEGKSDGEQVRVWVTGCASGEEAYSIAILLAEHTEHLDRPPGVQIFATDLDDESIIQARDGLYPETIAADVTPERLRRFFSQEGQHYRVKKQVREMVLFAPHNILRDPPFSRLDLVSCRNLLIYLNRETQDRVLEIFHFSLRSEGFLFLGSAESADSVPDLFTPVEKKLRIFRRCGVTSSVQYIPQMPLPGRWDIKIPETRMPGRKSYSYSELHQILLEQYAPPSVLVNEAYDVIHISENAGRYLRFGGGEPSRNLLTLMHPDLRLDARAALYTATQENRQTETRHIDVNIDGARRQVKVIVRPVRHSEFQPTFMLIIFDESGETAQTGAAGSPGAPSGATNDMNHVVQRLEDELQQTRRMLRTTVEQYETSTEELKASNEELQAINEELRAATEELETSKEELQSVNEELQTVNLELKDNVEELSHTNADLQNLLISTDIGTVFLDRKLRITRFTPRLADLFNVLQSDIGRPLAHITHKLEYAELAEDAERVLHTLETIEREVRSRDGRWHLARLLPYRTIEDKVEGVVLTFVDITRRRQAETRVKVGEERLRVLIDSVEDYGIFTTDLHGCVNTWNRGAENIFGYTESEIVGRSAEVMFTPEDRERGVPEQEMERARSEGRAEDERWHIRKDGSRFFASGVMTPLRDSEVLGYVKVLRDLTERQGMEDELRRSRDDLDVRVEERTSELEESNEQIKDLLHRIVTTQELERQRISRELHDHLGQQLTALRLSVESLKDQAGGRGRLREKAEQVQALVTQLDKDVDFLAWELRPAGLETVGLVAALENFIQEWSKHFRIAGEFHARGFDGVSKSGASFQLAPDFETNLYRIAQEALNNIVKHAEASRADVIFERRDHHAVLIIEDDGRGFDIEQQTQAEHRGMGLISMRERASLIGGTLEVETAPGEGTTVYVRVPQRSDGAGND
jgi:two-component system, chemotaxis family, CheB/CheR fusion protein